MSHEFKKGDIVRYVPRHPEFSSKEYRDKIAIVVRPMLEKPGATVTILWAPFDNPDRSGWDLGAMPENLELIGHIDE